VLLELYTGRLFLRPHTLDDVDLEIELFTDPEVARYMNGVQTAEEIRAEMHKYVRRCGGGCIGVWSVLDRQTSEKIGTGILLPMPVDEDDTNWELIDGPDIPDCEIEVGYALKRSAWGKGYATEICSRLLAFAFEETPLTDVVACIDDDNHRSQNVLVKCGMRDDGRRRAYGEQSQCFRITREQWLEDNDTGSRRAYISRAVAVDIPERIQEFWQQFLDTRADPVDANGRFYESFRIGLDDEDVAEGANLILSGKKTATSSPLWEYEDSGKTLPYPGALSVLEDGTWNPVGVVETTWTGIVPFGEVDQAFAFEYGEADGTLAGWRTMIRDYYADICVDMGREMSSDTPLVCERFRLVFPAN
jgi:RimJ/RimL family protein N-acetyltransferase/uncharacterized protein YhfF